MSQKRKRIHPGATCPVCGQSFEVLYAWLRTPRDCESHRRARAHLTTCNGCRDWHRETFGFGEEL